MDQMQNTLQKLNKHHRRKSIWMRVLSVLMGITVFITTYALILPAVTMDTNDASLLRIDWGEITWNDEDNIFENISLSMDTKQNYTYTLQYSDDGLTWTAVPGYATPKPGAHTAYTLFPQSSAMDQMFQDSPLNRKYRISGVNGKNIENTRTYNFVDVLEQIKPNFSEWLAEDFIEVFGGTPPTTKEEYLAAFDIYYQLYAATVACSEPTSSSDPVSVSATVDPAGTYNYKWLYYDETSRQWTEIEGQNGASIADVSTVLPTYGAYVKCRVYDDGGQYLAGSNKEFVNPKAYDFAEALVNINTGLGLQTVSANGSTYDLRLDQNIFNNMFYYTQSALNPDVPFFDAASYRYLLCKTYVRAKDNGASDTDALEEVRMLWNRYLYDLFDPDASSMKDEGGTGYPTAGTYGDQTLSWPKAQNDSFHGNIQPVINPLDYDFLESGVDYSNFISNMEKYATADAPGDANTDRKYNIDIIADGQAKARAPLALVFQIQTSWQMFDLRHANAMNGELGTQVGRLGEISAMATLYDIKYSILDFLNYVEEKYPGNNLVIGLTEIRHTVSDSMLDGTDSNGNDLYVTNDMDRLRQALYNWDIFGNCEHVHYTTTAIEAAVENLASNLQGWKDFYGKDVLYKDIRKVGVVVGGSTENASDDKGYGNAVTWSSFSGAGFNSVYGIRTAEGTPENADNVLSWLDMPYNNGTPYKDGVGNGFTKKYVATDRSQFAGALAEIADREFRVGGIEVTAIDKVVEDVYINDTVKPEFEMDYDKPITASICNKDGSKMYDIVITLTENGNYTITQIRYNENGTVKSTTDLTGDATLTVVPQESLASGVKSKLVLSFPQEQIIHLDLLAGPEDRPVQLDNSLEIIEYDNKTTDVKYVFDVLYNTKKAELNFGIKARENYLGSNNVYTNEALAYSGYAHINADGTDEYRVDCYDTPEVNVPLEFETVNGSSITVPAGTTYDLEDLDNGVIPADILDRLNQGYKQINGTLRYDWIEPNGTVHSIGDVHYTNGVADSAHPDLSDPYRFNYPGMYKAELRLTFVPDAVVENDNFHDGITLAKVNQKRHSGYVGINVVDSDAKTSITVQKLWAGSPGTDAVQFKLKNQNGTYYTGTGSEPVIYTLSASNNWKLEIDNLPALVSGVTQEYTAEEISIPGYDSEVKAGLTTTYTYSGTMSVDFTPSIATNGAKYIRVTYVYDGNEYTKLLPTSNAPSSATINAGSTYSFTIEDLTADEHGNAAPGYIKRIDYTSSSDPDDAASYVSFINSEYSPYDCRLDQVGYLMLDVTPSAKLGKDKDFVVTYTDHHGNTGSFTSHLGQDVNAGISYTAVLGTVPLSEYPYEITSITYNGASVGGTTTLNVGVVKPTFTFTPPAKINKNNTINVTVEDENGVQSVITLTAAQDLPAGTPVSIGANTYLPDGNYTVVNAVWGTTHLNPTVELQRFYQMSSTMISPSDIPAGTTVTVYYKENGVEKSFQATTSSAVSAGETVTLRNPQIIAGSPDSVFEVTNVTRGVGSGKNIIQVPFYQPLEADVEIYSTVTGFTCSSDISIKNTPNVALPSTGGHGPLIYVIVGLLLMVSAIIYGFVLRRKHERRLNN